MLRDGMAKDIALSKLIGGFNNRDELPEGHKNTFLGLADKIVTRVKQHAFRKEPNPFKRKDLERVLN